MRCNECFVRTRSNIESVDFLSFSPILGCGHDVEAGDFVHRFADLYYPSRRQSSSAFALVVDALRYRDVRRVRATNQ